VFLWLTYYRNLCKYVLLAGYSSCYQLLTMFRYLHPVYRVAFGNALGVAVVDYIRKCTVMVCMTDELGGKNKVTINP